MTHTRSDAQFLLCIDNGGSEDLDLGKVYVAWPDAAGARDGHVRVVDESGEDYLYPATQFIALDLPQKAREVLLAAS